MGVVIAVPVVFVLLQAFVTWPLFLVSSVSQETGIKFPVSARLEKGYGYHFASKIVAAKIIMRHTDLPEFLCQPRMEPSELPEAGGFPEARGTLCEHSIQVSDTRSAEFRRFNNGSPTWLLIDTQGTENAVVYIYMDEP